MDRNQVKSIFDDAADLPRESWAAFLDRACAGDQSLRDEVDRLLAAMEAGSRFMARARVDDDADQDCSSQDSAGTIVGRYVLIERIAEGGFGVVFLAEQRQPVLRRVALKIIKLGMDTKQVIARFEAERQALAMMDHPGIARVFDAGATDAGRPYFVMELVDGEPITSYCEQHGLDTRSRLDLFVQVCGAVQHAHTKGIIHRDLKPSNVLVAEIDGRPTPKIIDFGIAKAVAGRLTDRTLFTEGRQLVGTPEYMSPEQAAGASDDIDTRSDIYGLGVLLYELLTGVPPLDPARLRSAAWDEMLRIIREEEPARPSTRLSGLAETAPGQMDPERRARALKGDLDWIAMKCLEKDRARRYATANALAMDIERHLAGEPVLAAPPSRMYQTTKFVRRHRVGVLASAAVSLALLAGVAGTTFGLARADAASAESRRRMVRFMAVNGFFSSLTDSGWVHASTLDSALLFDEAVRREGPRYFDGGEGEADIRFVVGSNYFRLGRPAEGEAHLRRAWELRASVLGADDPETLACSVELARQLSLWYYYDAALPIAQHAVDVLEARFGREHPSTLDAYDALVIALSSAAMNQQVQDLHGIVPVMREALGPLHIITRRTTYRIIRSIQGSDASPELHALAESWAAEVLEAYDSGELAIDRLECEYRDVPWRTMWNTGRWLDADELTQSWMQHIERHGGNAYVGATRLWLTRATILVDFGQPREAEELVRSGIRSSECYAGRLYYDIYASHIWYAWCLHQQGRFLDEETFLRETIDTYTQQWGPNSRLVARMTELLAESLLAQHRLNEAEECALRARESYQALGPHTQDWGKVTYGAVLLAQGRPEEALPYFGTDPWFAGHLPHMIDVDPFLAHAECLRQLGRADEAGRMILEQLDRVTAVGQAPAPLVRKLVEPLAAIYDEQGRPEMAEACRARFAAVEARGP
jgi:serine/threonine protein kinase/tetratricopeptide (TPR) repeat protein